MELRFFSPMRQLREIEALLVEINGKVEEIMTTQEQFDSSLQEFLTAFDELVAAVDDALSGTAATDLSEEDSAIQAATQKAKDARDRITAASTPAPSTEPPAPSTQPVEQA
jgi:soluble cytochrome b562